nr:hybrid sensor histidine kinase/response regulator [Jannaschia sp. Os4]
MAGPLAADPDAPAPTGNLNLPRFLADELRRWRGHAAPDGTRVALDRGDGLPEVVRLDQLHLRRVVANLMANALRHAPGGAVDLAARLEDADLVIEARDDGPGFGDAGPEAAFAPAVSGAGSTGMGLHIARAHAERLGGRLTARNRPGGGAAVTLRLPEEAWRRDAPEGLPDLSGLRVLVADDSATTQALLRAMLSRMGAECETAADGIEALNWLARERFDLAVVDLEMPSLGGIEVIRSERLRQARGIAPPTPILAMTAYVLHDDRDAIIEAGAEDILPKPLGTVEEVGAILARHLAARTPSHWSPEAAPPVSAALLAELLAATDEADRAAFLAGLKADFAAVEARMSRAVEAEDPDALAAEAHALLSLAGVVGALPVQSRARALLTADGPDEAARIAPDVLARLADLRRMLGQLSDNP